MLVVHSSPFGSVSRTRVLLAPNELGESQPRELSGLLDTPLNSALGALRGLGRDGRVVGRNRMFVINPRYFARAELLPYLAKLAQWNNRLVTGLGMTRRRPRRTGQPV